MKYKIVFVFTSCLRTGPTQQMLNIAKNLDQEKFEVILVTLRNETPENSRLEKYLEAGINNYCIPTSKVDMVFGKASKLKKKLLEIRPDVIHSLGVFPDFAISKMGFKCQIITVRNYVYDDLIAWYGKIKGYILVKLHLFAMKRTAKTLTCSASLAQKYRDNLGLSFDYIQNGVDISRFNRVDLKTKLELRKKLNLPLDKQIYIYTGRLSTRKDQEFLLRLFAEREELKNIVLVVMTEGSEFERIRRIYTAPNIILPGFLPNVEEYLQASDVYISCSKSEGLPNGVLEAMAVGLPVVLSNIPQHLEITEANTCVGNVFSLGDEEDCINEIIKMEKADKERLGENAYKTVSTLFSDKNMSVKYQEEYLKIIEQNEVSEQV